MIRAYVHETMSFGYDVAISILNEQSGDDNGRPYRRVLHLRDDGAREWAELDYNSPLAPTFTLHHDEAAAVLAALTNHYQGADDQRALRKDYTDERARVDKLTDAVIDIARSTATNGVGHA
jgi:hypothetical protein